MEHHFLVRKPVKGFTLLELLITIAIIGILISVGVVSYSSAQKKSRDSRRMSDMKAVQAAFEQYYADNSGNYPATCDSDTTDYLPAGFPTDPKSSGTYMYNFNNVHCSTSSYCFCAHLEAGDGNEGSRAAGSGCSYDGGPYYCVGNLQ